MLRSEKMRISPTAMVGVLLVLVGCGGSAPPPASPSPPAPSPTTAPAPAAAPGAARRAVHIPAGTYNDEEFAAPRSGATETLLAADPAACASLGVDGKASQPLASATIPPGHVCRARTSNGYPIPDPTCTPGAYNPTLPVATLNSPKFKTPCVRDKATTPAQKAHTYDWYEIAKPSDNSGQNQVCELDHLVSLELGGADTLDNLWPQCGPDAVTLNERFFKIKDAVENYLAREVKAGRMDQRAAQRGIAEDWTQYLDAAAP
jgi:hypothetical protein